MSVPIGRRTPDSADLTNNFLNDIVRAGVVSAEIISVYEVDSTLLARLHHEMRVATRGLVRKQHHAAGAQI